MKTEIKRRVAIHFNNFFIVFIINGKELRDMFSLAFFTVVENRTLNSARRR